MGQDGITATTANGQTSKNVLPRNQDLEIARIQLDNTDRSFFFFGHNDDVGTSYEDVWPGSTDINWLTGGTKVEVLSTNAADTSDGLGVRSVELHGLSVTGADQDEVIVMNGTSAVESALTYCRINKLHNETVGTYGGSHQGNVTCQVTSGGSIQSIMVGEEGAVDSGVQYGLGEASNGFWTVPLGKVMYITDVTVNVQAGTNKSADVILYEREGILDTSAPMDPRRIIWNRFGIEGAHTETFKTHVKIKQLTDIFFRVKAQASGTRVDVKCHFYLLNRNTSGA